VSAPPEHRPPGWRGAPYIGVIGAGGGERSPVSSRDLELARAVGAGLARAHATLVCGGLGGVMEAACMGAREAGGLTVGILSGEDRAAANPYVAVALATGLGELRNGLVVRASDALIAIGGGWGTLSEIAFAMRTGRPVVALASWEDALEARWAVGRSGARERAAAGGGGAGARDGDPPPRATLPDGADITRAEDAEGAVRMALAVAARA
jgi:uncharacterized protein (TIGR00725 family)